MYRMSLLFAGTLILLNLNDNNLTTISPSITQLTSLKQLSLANNALTQLPPEIGTLHSLEELHLNGNNLFTLPYELGKLRNLKKLMLQKNSIKALPISIGECRKLSTLDVSGNQLEIFPAELQLLSFREFHFENNPLLPYIPVPADQHQEVIPLKVSAVNMCCMYSQIEIPLPNDL